MTADQPPLLQVNVIVTDLADTVRFLGLLGFAVEVPTDFPHLELPHSAGGVSVEFDERRPVQLWNSGAVQQTGGSTIVTFAVSDRQAVDATWQRVVDGGFGSAQQPFDAFWGSRFAIVIDADGNQFGLMSPRDPSRNTAPGDPAPR